MCDGSTVSRTEYANLFAAIGTTWGAGDGSSTFNLPNLIGRVAWGAKNNIGSYIDAGLPNISGEVSFYDGYSSPSYVKPTNLSGAFTSKSTTTEGKLGVFQSATSYPTITSIASFSASNYNSIYGKSSTVQPPAARLMPIIKY